MEQLLQSQKIEIDELSRWISNYKKDSAERKSLRYLEDKERTFTEAFRVISDNDEKIQNLREAKYESQPYFIEDTFKNVKMAFDKVIADVHDRLGKLKLIQTPTILPASTIANGQSLTQNGIEKSKTLPPGALSVPASGASGLENALTDNNGNDVDNVLETNGITLNASATIDEQPSILSMLYSELLDLLVAASDLPEDASKGLVSAHLDVLHATWSDFRTEMYKQRAGGDKIDFSFATMQQKYMKTTGELNDLIKKNVNVQQRINNDKFVNSQFKLPQHKLREFSGKQCEWRGFITLFDRMVHNNELANDGDKIEYLKTCVKGDAAKIINHVDPLPENYLTCYDLLRKRFDNKREMLANLIDNMLDLPKLDSESSDALKNMHDTIFESIMSIQNIGIDTNGWDFLLTHILTGKLDSSTSVHYECQIDNVKEPQSMRIFCRI